MFRKILICFLIAGLAACGMAQKKKMNDLNRSVESYVAALRWSRTEDARGFHLDRDHNKPEIDTSAMDEIRVTGYKIRKRIVNEALNEATITADLDYYNEEYGTLKNMTLVQQWWYDPEAERWFIESDFPTFE